MPRQIAPLVTVDGDRPEALNPPLRPLYLAYERPRSLAAVVDELCEAGFFVAVREGVRPGAEARVLEILVPRPTPPAVVARRLRLFHRDLVAVTEAIRRFRIDVYADQLHRASSALELLALDIRAAPPRAAHLASVILISGPGVDSGRLAECLGDAGLTARGIVELDASSRRPGYRRSSPDDDDIERLYLARA